MTTTVTKMEIERDQINRAIGFLKSEDYISAMALACAARNSPMTAAEEARAKVNPAMAAIDILDHVVQDRWTQWLEETAEEKWFKETHQQPKR